MMTDQTNTAALDADQARILAAAGAVDAQLNQADPLAGTADQGGAAGAQIGGMPATVEDPVEANAEMLTTLIAMIEPALPFLPQVYTPEVIKRIAVAYTKVEQKYGWNLSGQLPPELLLAIALIPPTAQAVLLARMHIAQAKAAAAGAGADGNQQ